MRPVESELYNVVWRTDKHDDANSGVSLFSKRAKKF